MLNQGGKEYTKGVLGQGLAKTDPPAKAVGHESLLFDELPAPAVRLLQEPLGEEGCRLFPVVGVLEKLKFEVKPEKYNFGGIFIGNLDTDLHIGDQVDHGYRVLRQLVVVQLKGPGAGR